MSSTHQQRNFGELDHSFIGPGKIDSDYDLIVSNETREILRITPDGRVIAPSLEDASEAGRIFVESIRTNLSQIHLNL